MGIIGNQGGHVWGHYIFFLSMILTRRRLDDIYHEWNRQQYISPDPLETVICYDSVGDREVVGLLAAGMAYGRVNALLVPLGKVLKVMGDSPKKFVIETPEKEIAEAVGGIIHRFARPNHIAALLAGAGTTIRRYGSLEAAFLRGYLGGRPDDLPAVRGLKSLESILRSGAVGHPGHLLADPAKGSACKRLFLFLRWMVRRDAVDPGGWDSVDPADLLLPLDTWTYRIALRAGWTQRQSADLKTIKEIGWALSELNPNDPVKYDFALSRFGIRNELNLETLFSSQN